MGRVIYHIEAHFFLIQTSLKIFQTFQTRSRKTGLKILRFALVGRSKNARYKEIHCFFRISL